MAEDISSAVVTTPADAVALVARLETRVSASLAAEGGIAASDLSPVVAGAEEPPD